MKIPIKDILITDRERKDFGNIAKFAESLKRFGQIQPLLVTKNKGEKPYRLIVGERRFRAALLAGWTEIDIALRETCSADMLKMLELEENLQRQDLHWSEEVKAKAKLDFLKRKEFGESKQGTYNVENEEKWNIQKTAALLNETPANVSRDIALAHAMEDPVVAKELMKYPKSVAFKRLKQNEEQKFRDKQVQNGSIKLSSDLINGDCLELLKTLDNDSIDLWITDPPFGVSNIDEAKGDYNEIMSELANANEEYMLELYPKLFKEMFRVMKPSAHFYIFFANEWYPFLEQQIKNIGFHFDPVPLIWRKVGTTTPFTGYNYMSSYEPIIYGCKEPREKYLHKASSNVLDFPRVTKEIQSHTFHKPPDLIDFLILQSSNPGDLILDTFAGSGQILESAKRLKRKGLGFEIDKDAYHKALEYLGE